MGALTAFLGYKGQIFMYGVAEVILSPPGKVLWFLLWWLTEVL